MTSTQAMLNETKVTAVYEDGRTEELVMRQLKLRALYKYIDHLSLDDVPAIVALCCDRPAEWVDTLTVDSFTELSRIATEQNFTKAMRIVESDPVAFAKCGKLLAKLTEAIKHLPSVSTGSSPAPSSSASAAENPSASSISPAAG
jgi:hypothetical protein